MEAKKTLLKIEENIRLDESVCLFVIFTIVEYLMEYILNSILCSLGWP